MATTDITRLSPEQRAWRWRIFAITWLAYAGFYLCRKNLSVVMPFMTRDLAFSNVQLANVVFGYSLLYALGQFMFGMLADRYGSRAVVLTGLLVAIASNLFLGAVSSLVLLTLAASLNGLGQSAGWPGLVKNMAAWFRPRERGVVMAWWTTNYVIGGFVGTVFATFTVTSLWLFPGWGWRRGLWIPAITLLGVTVLFAWLARNRPSDAHLPEIVDPDEVSPASGERPSSPAQIMDRQTVEVYLRMLGDWEVWTAAIGALFCKITRYSFLFWLPLYLTQRRGYAAGEAGYTSSLFELAGFGGALLGGYVSDKLMQSRRLPVAAMMMWGLALACWLHPWLAEHGRLGGALGIALIGVMNYGPDTILQGAAAQDIGKRWGVGKTSGFINGVSSIGQLISAYLVGTVSQHYGWDVLFYVFMALALAGGTVLATRWRHVNDLR
jgi:MFS transporter, OPA family, sugar phosphate sensor protein UhpC